MGAVAKTFGALLLILGLLGLVGGIGAAGYGYMQEEDNQENGLFRDQDKSDENQAIILAGAIAAGVGLLFMIVGAIMLASGRKSTVIIQGGNGQPTTIVTSSGKVKTAPAALAAASADVASSTQEVKSGKGAASTSASTSAKSPSKSAAASASGAAAVPAKNTNARTVAVLGGMLLVIGLVVVFVLAQSGDNPLLGNGNANEPKDDVVAPPTYFNETLSNAFNLPLVGSAGEDTFDLVPALTTRSVTVYANWTQAQAGGAETLHFVIYVNGNVTREGDWTSGYVERIEFPAGATSIAFSVTAPEGAAIASQDFMVTVVQRN